MLTVWFPRHGISYTTFEYWSLEVTSTGISLKITNAGSVAGAETVQMYIAADQETSSIARPKKELKGFSKVFLQPNETSDVRISFDQFTVAFWDEEISRWMCERGTYRVLVGSSSQDIRCEGLLKLGTSTTWSGL